MALIPSILAGQIIAAFQKQSAIASAGGDLASSQQQLALDLATAIDAYIRTATIIVPPGQIVATAGSPAAQTGATTAPSPPAIIS